MGLIVGCGAYDTWVSLAGSWPRPTRAWASLYSGIRCATGPDSCARVRDPGHGQGPDDGGPVRCAVPRYRPGAVNGISPDGEEKERSMGPEAPTSTERRTPSGTLPPSQATDSARFGVATSS